MVKNQFDSIRFISVQFEFIRVNLISDRSKQDFQSESFRTWVDPNGIFNPDQFNLFWFIQIKPQLIGLV